MEQRTTEQTKELIERAASILGVNASEFTIQAATKAARETIRDYQLTVLKPEAHKAFVKAFEATKPTSGLITLMKLKAAASTGNDGR